MKRLTVVLPKRAVILGFLYMAVQLLILPSLLTFGNWLLGTPLSVAQLNFAFFAINFIFITVAYRHYLLDNLKILFQYPWQVLRYAGAGLILYWISSFVVNFCILQISPDFFNVNDQSISQMTQDNYALMSIGTILLVPVVEEILYRGVVFGSLYPKSPVLAYILSTCLFSAIHIIGYIGTFAPMQLLLCFLQYVPAGICLAWAYTKADSIWAPILIHMAVNQVGNISMR